MAVNFAGARSIDDRRRRRIATETEQSTPAIRAENERAGYLKIRRFQPDAQEPARSPIVSLLPSSCWRIWLNCVGIPSLVLGLLLCSLSVSERIDAPLRGILDYEQGQAWRFLRGLTLLGCAGLCWLISWFRSASVRDFEGCFKSWYWSGWILLIMGLLAGTDGYVVLGTVLQHYARARIANFTTLAWLIPMLALLIEPLRCFTREMWHCRRSWLGLWASCLAGVVYAWARLEGPHTQGRIAPELLQQTAAIASVMTPSFLFSALLSQVHYVMYVSSDPVPKRTSWILSGLLRGMTAIRQGSRMLLQTGFTLCTRGLGGVQTGLKQWADTRRAARQERDLEQPRRKSREKSKPTPSSSEETESSEESSSSSRRRTSLRTRQNKGTSSRAGTGSSKSTRQTSSEIETVEAVDPENNSDWKEAASEAENVGNPRGTREEKPRIRLKSKPLAPVSAQSSPAEPASPRDEVPPSTPSPSSGGGAEQWNEEDEDEEGNDGIDPELLRGLSKKERRRLRKMHREQQRAKAG